MSILNLEYNGGSRGRAPRNKRNLKVWIGVGLVGAVIGIGSTLASTITINNGNSTEFGQGISTTIFCGGAKQTVQVTPISSFDNTDPIPADAFYVSQIKVSGIPSACAGVDFSVSIYEGLTSDPAFVPSPDPLPMNETMATAYLGGVLTAGTANVWFPDNCLTDQNVVVQCDPSAPNNYQAQGALVWFDNVGAPAAMDPADSTAVVVKSDHSTPDNGSFTLTLPQKWLIKASSVSKLVVETRTDVNGFQLWSLGQNPNAPLT